MEALGRVIFHWATAGSYRGALYRAQWTHQKTHRLFCVENKNIWIYGWEQDVIWVHDNECKASELELQLYVDLGKIDVFYLYGAKGATNSEDVKFCCDGALVPIEKVRYGRSEKVRNDTRIITNEEPI